MTRTISKFLAVIMMINLVLMSSPEPTVADSRIEPLEKVSTYRNGNIKQTISKGQKGIEYNIDSIHIEYNESFKINKAIPNYKEKIELFLNGNIKDSELKYRFEFDEKNSVIKVKLKQGQSDKTHMKPFILRKHSLYNIKIPADFFIDKNGEKSKEINHVFSTKGDGLYSRDIIKDISPENKQTLIDYKKGEIKVEFIDDIYLSDYIKNNLEKGFEIKSKSISNPSVPEYDDFIVEDINNYQVEVGTGANSHILTFKTENLNDFATYDLTLKAGAVQLKNSGNLGYENIVYNNTQNIVFSTDNWIDSINLSTSENWIPYKLPLANVEDVPVNPLIQVKFKYPVELRDKSKIKFSSDAHDFSIDLEEDSWINYDGNTLKLDINSFFRKGENPLRKHTTYKITIESGALRLKDYNYSSTNRQIQNKDMEIYFITGTDVIDEDPGLNMLEYSSDPNNMDNLINLDSNVDMKSTNKINTTRLDSDGNIYIHFNRNIKWNRWTNNVKNNKEALPYFKLYKIPSAYERDYSDKGVVFDKQFRYKKDGKPHTKDGTLEDEVVIESVEIQGDKIKITPKYELVNLNEYRIVLSDKDIITDDFEKKLRSNINQKIWTGPNQKTEKPKWILGEDIKAEEIKENTNSPFKEYKLFGVPNYNEHIDQENGKPIVVYVDREVIVNPEKINPLYGIRLSEKYGYGNSIKWYKIEHLGSGSDKKTKISIYPNGVLDAGKYYDFEIPEDTFVTRNGEKFDQGIKFNFVVEGDKKDKRGIYSVDITNGNPPLTTKDFPSTVSPIELDIKGYNFSEDIKNIKFIRRRDEHTIELRPRYIEFKDVTRLQAEIKGDAALKFSQEENGGVYDVHVEFRSGQTAKAEKSLGTTLTVKARPIVLDTNPKNGQEYVDEKAIYPGHISITFEDLDGQLRLMSGEKDYSGIKIKKNNENIITTNFLDTAEDMKISRSEGKLTIRLPLQNPLMENTKYEITIPENFVDFVDIVGGTGGNKEYYWKFNTSFDPVSNVEFKGSVPEDYDEEYPITLKGDFFQDKASVYFVDLGGKEYRAYSVNVKDANRAEVYLPRRRNRLKPGLYDIVIENDDNHKADYKYGVLSVVASGDYLTNEEYNQEDRDIKQATKTSSGELELSRRYRGRSLDLDSLLGEGVLVRNINYDGSWISRLETRSKWSDIELSGVSRNNSREPIIVSLGRAEPLKAENIKKRLTGNSIKSDFIQISGSNYDISSADISIPYQGSKGNNLRVLRYDEDTRTVERTYNFLVDKNNKKVEITDGKKGIYVVVE